MHWTNLDNVTRLFALEYAITTTSSHTSNIEKLGAVDHVVVLASRNTNSIGLNLEAQAAFIFPQRRGDSRLHAWWRDLAGGVK